MIEVINLEKHFGDSKVLKGINITIEKGDIVVVIGPSGSGKSTFLRCLNCMEDPTEGVWAWCSSISICLTIRRSYRILCWRRFWCSVRSFDRQNAETFGSGGRTCSGRQGQ